jgi:hypothetical protein
MFLVESRHNDMSIGTESAAQGRTTELISRDEQ